MKDEALLSHVFGSDRSSRNDDVRSSVCPFGSNLSRAVNLLLHLSRSESLTSFQRAFKENSQARSILLAHKYIEHIQTTLKEQSEH